jgi:hypothetical protein
MQVLRFFLELMNQPYQQWGIYGVSVKSDLPDLVHRFSDALTR